MLVEKIIRWSRSERSRAEKAIALFVGVVIFVLLFPLLFIYGGQALDSSLGLQNLLPAPVNVIAGLFLVAVGWPFAFWSVYIQYEIGKGTPVPAAPPKKLITTGPYKYCRNPMVLGTFLFYVGLSMIFNTVSALFILIPLVLAPLLVFIKVVEEKELEIRFGHEYLEYKKNTPFLIPHPKLGWKRNGSPS